MLRASIQDPAGALMEEVVETVRLPGEQGEFEVMAYHVPFLAVLTAGRIWITRQGGGSRVLAIPGGVAWGMAEQVVVLVDAWADSH